MLRDERDFRIEELKKEERANALRISPYLTGASSFFASNSREARIKIDYLNRSTALAIKRTTRGIGSFYADVFLRPAVNAGMLFIKTGALDRLFSNEVRRTGEVITDSASKAAGVSFNTYSGIRLPSVDTLSSLNSATGTEYSASAYLTNGIRYERNSLFPSGDMNLFEYLDLGAGRV